MITITTPVVANSERTLGLYRTARWLALFTIVYNIGEGLVSTILGFQDETLALFGFGLDSFIETISGVGVLVMLRRLERTANTSTKSDRTEFERTALRITGWSFYGLSVMLAVTTVVNIVAGEVPESTFWGIVVACVSIVVMTVLVIAKKKVGRTLGSIPIIADANCTLVCVYMSVVVLISALLYESTHFAYADAIGALGVLWFSVKEGRECFQKVKGHECGCEDACS
ncbi:MAG: cation transporter [Bradyrhizobiaceae bacterium]|nr:cation transporter [Bradyrhizobiaceae bacterium]